jgi:hypothetical protein
MDILGTSVAGTEQLRIVVPRGRLICQKSHDDFILTPIIGHPLKYESRNCPREIVHNRLWVGGIAAATNECVLRATEVNHIVLLRGSRGKLLRTRFENFLTYSEHIIDDSNIVSSVLGAVHFISIRLMRGERILVHETVLSSISKNICGLVLRVLRPDMCVQNVINVLLFGQSFGHINNYGDPFSLTAIDAERRRLVSLARQWTAIASRRSVLAKLPWWPGLDIIHAIAARIDPLFKPRDGRKARCARMTASGEMARAGGHSDPSRLL